MFDFSYSLIKPLVLIISTSLLINCGGGGGGSSDDSDTPPISQLPIANAGSDQTVDENDTVSLNASASTDPQNDTLSYSWVQTAGETVALSNTTIVDPSFTAPELTATVTLIFEVTVTDTNLNSSTDSVSIIVNADNDAPVSNAGNDQTVDENALVNLTATASTDPENESLSYNWNQLSGTSVVLSDSTSVTPNFTAPELLTSEVLTFELTVTDGANNTNSDSVSINVTANNDSPTANAGPDQLVLENKTVTLNAELSTDPENESLDYTWNQISGPTVSLSDNNIQQPEFLSPVIALSETLIFELSVEDSAGNQSIDTVHIDVTTWRDCNVNSDGNQLAECVLVDDFSRDYLSVDQWQDKSTTTWVDDDDQSLMISVNRDSGSKNSSLDFNTTGINSIRATATIENAETDIGNTGVYARVGGVFYKGIDPDLTISSSGEDVSGFVYLRDRGNGLEAWWRVYSPRLRVQLEEQLIAPGVLVDGNSYPLSVEHTPGSNQFTFSVAGVSAIIAGPQHFSDASSGRKRLTAGVSQLSDFARDFGHGSIQARFDDVFVNNTSYDDFSSGSLGSNWRSAERKVEVESGKLVMEIGAAGKDSSTTVRPSKRYLGSENKHFESKVLLDSDTNIAAGALGLVKVSANVYDEFTLAEYTAQVVFEIQSDGSVGAYGELRNPDGSLRRTRFVFDSYNYVLGEEYTVTVDLLDDRVFMSIISPNGSSKSGYSPILPGGEVSVGPGTGPQFEITTEISSNASDSYLKAVFDEVYTYFENTCENADNVNWVQSGDECIKVQTFTGNNLIDNPTLVVLLHGSGGVGGLYDQADRIDSNEVVSVAVVEPGFYDFQGNFSTGNTFGRPADSYTPYNIDTVASVINQLKDHYSASKVIVTGTSGGAIYTGLLLGRHPDLIDSALLAACPCNRQVLTRSLDPIDFVSAIPTTTEVVLNSETGDRQHPYEQAEEYVDALQAEGVNTSLEEWTGIGAYFFTQDHADRINTLINN
jgi:poly(3-hydroxybutyrate) depolymerase